MKEYKSYGLQTCKKHILLYIRFTSELEAENWAKNNVRPQHNWRNIYYVVDMTP